MLESTPMPQPQSNFLPQKQEWSIIYKHRAQQLQKAKSMEKIMSQEKKDSLKRQLDEQINSKNSAGQAVKEEARHYSEYVAQKAIQMKEKEERAKFEKYIQRKHIQEQNQMRSLPLRHKQDLSYNLEIGLKSQLEKKQRAESIRKDVVSTLDLQLMHKEEERRRQRQEEIDLFNKNQAYLHQQYTDRNKYAKKYQQNEGVYNQYREIFHQKMRKDRQFQHKIVDEVQQRKQEEDTRKRSLTNLEKQRKSMQMKDTLQRQLQLINHRRSEQKNTDPQQASYSFINNIFREKKAPFDKKQYSQYLEKQAQEQRLNKLQQQYMSQQQYKFNSNQLNKALSGNYTFDRYHDRSIGTLGDRLSINNTEPLQGNDADLVKTKLDTLRNRNRSMIHSRSEMDYIL